MLKPPHSTEDKLFKHIRINSAKCDTVDSFNPGSSGKCERYAFLDEYKTVQQETYVALVKTALCLLHKQSFVKTKTSDDVIIKSNRRNSHRSRLI